MPEPGPLACGPEAAPGGQDWGNVPDHPANLGDRPPMTLAGSRGSSTMRPAVAGVERRRRRDQDRCNCEQATCNIAIPSAWSRRSSDC